MKPATRILIAAAIASPTAAAVAVVALIVTAFTALAGTDSGSDELWAAVCQGDGGDASSLSAEQIGNASTIAAVATGRELGVDGAVIGIMTALTESSLINVDYGDTAGPDSRGLFQQRDSWGSLAERMDPATAAGLFFDRLEAIEDWRALDPWIAAQSVQRSAFADGSNYAAHYQLAISIIAALVDDETDDETGDEGIGFDLAGFCAADAPVGITNGGWGGYSNGQIPATALCPLTAAGHLLRCDAATAWNAMAAAYETETGSALCITDSYRTLDVQIRLRAEKPTLAAVPGTSNHGWALAVDLCEPDRTGMGFSTGTYLWLMATGTRFGFTHPAWAEPGRGQEEPWHWEYTRGAA